MSPLRLSLFVALGASCAAAVEVSVCRDATYDITVDAASLCSGSGAAPAGWSCPKAGDVAVADCLSTLASFGSGTCVAPEDAVCQVVNGDTWGCVLPSLGCNTLVVVESACETWDYSGDDTVDSSGSFDGNEDYDESWFMQTTELRELYDCGNKPTPAPTTATPDPTPASTESNTTKAPAATTTPAPTEAAAAFAAVIVAAVAVVYARKRHVKEDVEEGGEDDESADESEEKDESMEEKEEKAEVETESTSPVVPPTPAVVTGEMATTPVAAATMAKVTTPATTPAVTSSSDSTVEISSDHTSESADDDAREIAGTNSPKEEVTVKDD
ncbi:hypothetical protein AM588_10004808 [Phytophthora nicotianae]|uniref:Carbohydrate-binding protein n=1 Tax=Phytophthora nicotianae TaxID=4792 RepID=A0A0W8D4E0_PHYNI|nr:hypothetical protein AM588_10004808 [Phytophthora nicotianae]